MNDNQSSLSRLYHSLGAKIIIPYLLLTLTVAGIGAFLLTTFITDTLNERLTNQLIDAGRVVSERMVNYEEERLNTLRLVAGTQGVADNLIHDNADALETLVLPLILNNDADAVELLNMEGTEVYGWQRIPGAPLSDAITRSGSDFAHLADVQFVLNGQTDEFGDKSVFLSETPEGHILFTIGPVFDADGRQVGAALVGSYLRFMTIDPLKTPARVTFYDKMAWSLTPPQAAPLNSPRHWRKTLKNWRSSGSSCSSAQNGCRWSRQSANRSTHRRCHFAQPGIFTGLWPLAAA
ncbi:MAG: cache domain-containing protein [Chloroflexi bacterium]|nr:cache domain-containing protein [Chloroflexota bacterium]